MAFDPIDMTELKCQAGEPRLMDGGVLQKPVAGGVTTRIGRLGLRYAIDFHAPPESIEPEGRRWLMDLQMAKQRGVVIAYPQFGFRVGSPGSPTVDGAVAGGMTLPITGATPNYALRKGQALNVIKAGRSYLYFAAAQVILDGSGAGDIALSVPLRTKLVGGESVNLAKPVIEGWLPEGDLGWSLEMARTMGIDIPVGERA